VLRPEVQTPMLPKKERLKWQAGMFLGMLNFLQKDVAETK
jgi:hypothetical protein